MEEPDKAGFNVSVSDRERSSRQMMTLNIFVLMVMAAGLVGFFATDIRSDATSLERLATGGLAFATAFASLIAGYRVISRFPTDADQLNRAVAADFQQFEKNVKQDIFRELSERYSEKIIPLDFVKDQIQSRLDEGLVKAIDDALRERLTEGAKWVDVVSYIDEANSRISLELNGPGGRAEKRASWLLRGALAVGGIGLAIAIYRVFTLVDLRDSLLALSTSLGDKSAWPYVIALAAPWVSLIALVEFSALMLLKVSNQFTAEQRKYTELFKALNERLLALKVIVRSGTSEDVSRAASQLLRDVKTVEATDVNFEESISAITKITESLAAVVKQFASKEAKPSD